MELRPLDRDLFYSIELKNYCAFTLNETSQHINTYKVTQRQVEKVKKLIDEDLAG